MMKKISEVLGISINDLYNAFESVDINSIEKDDSERIIKFKKYSILSCLFVVIAPLLLLYIKLFGAYNERNDTVIDVINAIFFITAIAITIISIIFMVVQAGNLFSFYKIKYYQIRYKKIMQFYLTIYGGLLIASILGDVFIFVF